VLKTRTSEINGANPCTDAAAGNVTVSATSPVADSMERIAPARRDFLIGIRRLIASVTFMMRTVLLDRPPATALSCAKGPLLYP
jgi:hypothetical protein